MIEFQNISKHFGGVRALHDVSLTIQPGHVHALMGENGAGKSTLGKTLAGIHRPDTGQIVLNGQPKQFRSPGDALLAGVAMVHQELAFCPNLTIAENLCLGRLPRRWGFLRDRPAMRATARSLLQRIGVDLDVDLKMAHLSTAQEQLVQIAAAIGTGARYIVFDEPTSSLAEVEARQLFDLIRSLRQEGVSIIYVSHRMPEVFALADRISVLRDGRYVDTVDAAGATEDSIVKLMAGRDIERGRSAPPAVLPDAPVRLHVDGLSSAGRFQNVGFALRAGEIVGLAGLVGAGRSEIAEALFGIDRRARGKVSVDSAPLTLGSTRTSMAAGVALVPEDRKRQGLVLEMSCRNNVALPLTRELTRAGMLRTGQLNELTARLFDRLKLKAASPHVAASSLSGGNQQKVVLAKWLARNARILITDEPTRGVDVGAKESIYELLMDVASEGASILLISSELPELTRLAHRILVMREGQLVAEFSRNEFDEDRILHAMVAGSAIN